MHITFQLRSDASVLLLEWWSQRYLFCRPVYSFLWISPPKSCQVRAKRHTHASCATDTNEQDECFDTVNLAMQTQDYLQEQCTLSSKMMSEGTCI